MSIEVMKQALEALNNALEIIPRAGHSAGMQRHAADALRQAIAEAEKPWVKTYAGGKPNYTTPFELKEKNT
jgi:hypothetical protein